MIKSYVITITELDDADDAANELDGELMKITLLKNTIGIIETHEEFVLSGIYDKIIQRLPFPSAGATGASQNSNGLCDSYILSILVLTSDVCEFSCAVSDIIPESGDVSALSRKCYADARAKLPCAPTLALLYAPFLAHHTSGEYIAPISEIEPAVPIFGKTANDNQGSKVEGNNSKTLMCGNYYNDRLVIALITSIKPRFYLKAFTNDSVAMPRIGSVTASKKNKLLEINNINAIKFFENMGININNKGNDGLLTSALVFDMPMGEHAGAAVARAPIYIDSDGLFTAGIIPEGSILSIAFSTKETIIDTTTQLLREINADYTSGTAIIYSCIGRRNCLLREPFMEFELISEYLSKRFTYIAGYASGEICPVSVTETKSNNSEHNQTLIACVF